MCWEEGAGHLWGLPISVFHYGVTLAQQPCPHSPTGDLGEIAGVNGQNSKGMYRGGKPGTGKLYTDVCLCGSAHTSGCVVDGWLWGYSRTFMQYYYYYGIIHYQHL